MLLLINKKFSNCSQFSTHTHLSISNFLFETTLSVINDHFLCIAHLALGPQGLRGCKWSCSNISSLPGSLNPLGDQELCIWQVKFEVSDIHIELSSKVLDIGA